MVTKWIINPHARQTTLKKKENTKNQSFSKLSGPFLPYV